MLKTTYKPTAASGQSPLPSGWTEHKAPSGHLYYYNAESKKSTYTRPSLQLEQKEPEQRPESLQPAFQPQVQYPTAAGHGSNNWQAKSDSARWHPHDRYGQSQRHQEHGKRVQPQDRPKHKREIPGAEPWILVRTKLKRRFVHNPKTGESLWKFPKDVMACVVELDKVERERKARHANGEYSEDETDTHTVVRLNEAAKNDAGVNQELYSEEYEEVEVTEEEEDDEQHAKRQKPDEPQEQAVEFNEDDIAYQLAQMEEMAELGEDRDRFGYDEAPALADDDARALFTDLLNDFRISPYTPWDRVIEEGDIIDDERYTILPNMKSRKEAFDDWCRVKAQEIKAIRDEQAKIDPQVPYMRFLDNKATPKLYWPEFRRKYQKEPELKDRKLTDKDREKWYREHISRLKLPESKLRSDLGDLLKSIPARELNKNTSLDTLPPSLLRDIRYISLPPKKRDPLVETFIATIAPAAPGDGEALSAEDEARMQKERSERERREKALADRVEAVRAQQARQLKDLGQSKAVLREETAEVDRAKRIGLDGLMGHFSPSED